MSTAPRPCTRPPAIAPDQGPWVHGSVPGATTSTCAVERDPARERAAERDREREQLAARRLLAGMAGMRAQGGEVVLDQLGLEARAPPRGG